MIDHDTFVDCLRQQRCVRLAFVSKKEGGAVRERICAPMDYGPDRRAADQRDRYHLYDLESKHPLKKLGEEIVRLEVLEQSFDPGTFVTWDTRSSPWWLARDWGAYS
jgi:hypothetical protein